MFANGTYYDTATAIATGADFPDVRIMIVGNKHDCKSPIEDFNSTFPVAVPWSRPSAALLSLKKDVMGSGVSATCWYYGLELHKTQNVGIFM
jgi:hypothetical protein